MTKTKDTGVEKRTLVKNTPGGKLCDVTKTVFIQRGILKMENKGKILTNDVMTAKKSDQVYREP